MSDDTAGGASAVAPLLLLLLRAPRGEACGSACGELGRGRAFALGDFFTYDCFSKRSVETGSGAMEGIDPKERESSIAAPAIRGRRARFRVKSSRERVTACGGALPPR